MFRKCGNGKQLLSAYELEFSSGAEKGKSCVLVSNGKLEALFNKDNALDISWVKFCGINMSFLSKNGLNSKNGPFSETFDGGFLYTCGTDNVSTCVKDRPVHGSMHHAKAENVSVIYGEDKITVKGIVRESGLFGKNLVFSRSFDVFKDKILINDEVINNGYTDTDYCLLYHVNYGYPFLDECLRLEADLKSSEGLTPYARSRTDKQFSVTPPVDGGEEEVFYNYLSTGRVALINENIGVKAEMLYDLNDFPVTLQWKSMVSGDYALGIEPSTTRFDRFEKSKLCKGTKKSYKIQINFGEINKC